MATFTENVGIFFTVPTAAGKDLPQPRSVLYLLRREIQDCLIGAVVPEDAVLLKPTRHRLFATVMLIFAGMDLLGKFAAGEDSRGLAGARFKTFLEKFAMIRDDDTELRHQVTEGEARVIYRFRNSLMHSFGLYSEVDGAPIHHFIFQSWSPGPVVREREDGAWHLSIDDLYEMFVHAVENYRSALLADTALGANFECMFPKYGTLFTLGPTVPAKP